MRLLTGEPVKGMEKLAQSVRGLKDLELDISSDSVTKSAHSQELNALTEKVEALTLPIQASLLDELDKEYRECYWSVLAESLTNFRYLQSSSARFG